MNKNEQGQEEGEREWGGRAEEKEEERGELCLSRFRILRRRGKEGRERERKGSWPCMTPARASLPRAHYFASSSLQSQRKNFNVDDDDDDALLASLYDLNGDETAAE